MSAAWAHVEGNNLARDAAGLPSETFTVPICPRCKRPAVGWPVDRGDRCSPRDWVNCIRSLSLVGAPSP